MKVVYFDRERIEATLLKIKLFALLESEALDRLCVTSDVVRIPCGQFLIKRGEEADCMYVVLRGRVRVLHAREVSNSGSSPDMGPGETVGEMALLRGGLRSASIQACRECLVLKIRRYQFQEIMKEWPGVSFEIARLLTDRMLDERRFIRRRANVRTVVLIPGRDEALFRTFRERLLGELEREGPVCHLSSASLAELAPDAVLPSGTNADADEYDEGDARLVEALDQKEDTHRFVVLSADPEVTPWSEFCLRHGDRLLLIHEHDSAADLTDVEQLLFGPGIDFLTELRAELYLLHPASDKSQISGTNEWLAERPVYRHHHLTSDDAADYQRAVRFLSGKAVGVVIGGGSSLAGGAVGVILGLRERGIPIDMIGGNSAGSVVAAGVAMGDTDPRSIGGRVVSFVKGLTSFWSYGIPAVGLVRRGRHRKIFKRLFGERHIEDLPLNYFAVATNLSTGELVPYRDGPLWLACRTSSGIPGLAHPTLKEGDLLYDGALVANLPSAVMAEKCDGHIILIDIMPDGGFTNESPRPPSAWRLFWSKINPFSRDKPITILDILFRTCCVSNLSATRDAAHAVADYTFVVPIAGHSPLHAKVVWDTFEVGYQFAKEQLAQPDWDSWPQVESGQSVE